MMAAVQHDQRFVHGRTCPICQGCETDPRGKDRRCYGFISADGLYVHCTRAISSAVTYHTESSTYAHRRTGLCPCGVTHTPALFTLPRTPVSPPARQGAKAGPGRQVAEYIYHDATGQPVHRVTRHELPEGKTFLTWHRTTADAWASGIGSLPRVLYRLPAVLAAPPATPVFVVEGEQCADALITLGLVATTTMHGAGKWHQTPDASEALRGHKVILLPDNDAPGHKHVTSIATALQGCAASVRIVTLPSLPAKGDIVDWLAAGGTRDALLTLCADTPVWEPASTADHATDDTVAADDAAPRRYHLYSAADLKSLPPVDWLMQGVLTQAGSSFLVGSEGTGKSFLALDWGLSIALGIPWQGHPIRHPGPVVYIAGEGLYGISKRIAVWEARHQCLADHFYVLGEAVPLLQPDAVNMLLDTLADLPETPILMIIDTLARAIVGGDENASRDVGLAIAAADRIRHTFSAHVLTVHHKNKNGGVRGSSAVPGATDTMIDVTRDGSLITVTCSKQKDFEEFAPITLALRTVTLDGSPDTSSCLLEAVDGSAPGFLPDSQRKVLQSLTLFGTDGAQGTEWMHASDLPDRTFYDARAKVERAGWVIGKRIGTGVRYLLTPLGVATLKAVSA